MPRISTLFVVVCVCVVGTVGSTQAAVYHEAAVKHRKTTKRPKSSAKVHGLTAPVLLEPANGAGVEQVPTLAWGAVNGAAEYEYQIAASANFDSIVIGSGIGKGTSTTYNLAAALEKPVPNGTYYWRVRGLTKTKQAGAWSNTRTIVKHWTAAPQPLRPASGAAITWPAVPLVLEWTAVPGATEYIVTIATDPALSNIVLGSATSPQKTAGTVFALPGTLAAGQSYYWAITPVDVEAHRGTRSAVREFTWSWPTTTTASINPLNPDFGETPFTSERTLKSTPEFTWNPIPGAAHYEVEVNSAEGFPPGSTWYKGTTIGTTASPVLALNNNEYYWRVRAIDSAGNAGVWNPGPSFRKAFDYEPPTIRNLIMTDAHEAPMPPDPTTGNPIVKWSPVPGAASYEVEVLPAKYGCGTYELAITSTPAWTPIRNGTHVGQSNWPNPQSSSVSLTPGESYCVQVAARSDVDALGHQIESALTPLGGGVAFKYEPRTTRCKKAREDEQTAKEDEEKGNAKAAAEAKLAFETIYKTYEYLSKAECEHELGPVTPVSYVLPQSGSYSARTPLFTWEPVPGATSYYVAISRDPLFTNVVDVAHTDGTAYAAPVGGEEPLDDQTTTYYWSVFAVEGEFPHELLMGSISHHYEFNKHSVPPTLLSPVGGVEVRTQPTFKWSPAEGALNYTLEVSENPSFGELIDHVKTDSTAYTSSSTYPAATPLYWRVRANDANQSNEHDGLTWSPTGTFARTLPIPSPAASTTEGQGLPVRSWSPVEGATAYELHVELPNGTTKDFTLDSTSFTPTELFGNGIWHWQVRAAFPKGIFGTTPGGYFTPPQPFVHELAPPTGVIGIKSGSRIVISWNPDQYAKEYEVDISTSDTFSSTIESRKVGGSSWAPNVDLSLPANRGALYWRVAAVDPGNNVGAYATGSFVPPKPKAKCVVKKIKNGKKTVKKCVVPKHKAAKTKKKHG